MRSLPCSQTRSPSTPHLGHLQRSLPCAQYHLRPTQIPRVSSPFASYLYHAPRSLALICLGAFGYSLSIFWWRTARFSPERGGDSSSRRSRGSLSKRLSRRFGTKSGISFRQFLLHRTRKTPCTHIEACRHRKQCAGSILCGQIQRAVHTVQTCASVSPW